MSDSRTDIICEREWLGEYFSRCRRAAFARDVPGPLIQNAGRKVIIAGNGGSAATASHCAVDFTKA